MIDLILMRMKDEVVKHANIMSRILKVDVEVVDNNMNLIAGKFNRYAHTNEDGTVFIGKVYKAVIETGEKQIIKDPGEHPLCADCVQRDTCEEKFEMSAPIKLYDEVIGVIGFVCFTDEQNDYIQSNYDMFTDFLDQMTGLISLKATQMFENERMQVMTNMINDIFDKIDEGVLVFDKEQNVQKVNAVAQDILGITIEENKKLDIELQKLNEHVMGTHEYVAAYDDKEINVAGRFFDFYGESYNRVFIFKDINTIKDSARAFMSSYEKIGVNRLLGNSKALLMLKDKIKRVASTTSSVMIIGESGTGKELVARSLHEESDRYDQPFVAINCGAIPENLLESELFGYVKGAFTGADPRGKTGKFELAHKGTLFLDEIGDMPLHIQVKLLRVLEEREIVKLGENKSIKIDVRVVAATNKNLEELIKEQIFREDLFYRLNVIPLSTTPLRKREGDVKLLADYFINRYSDIFNKQIRNIDKSFWECLDHYDWPGNVRELQNTMEYVINLSRNHGDLNEDILPDKVKHQEEKIKDEEFNIEVLEKQVILKALSEFGSDGPSKRIVAEQLGIGIATLYRKMKKYGIRIEE